VLTVRARVVLRACRGRGRVGERKSLFALLLSAGAIVNQFISQRGDDQQQTARSSRLCAMYATLGSTLEVASSHQQITIVQIAF
jgi:hypothetical protein